MSDPADWYRNIPIFTRYWFTGTIALTLAGRFNILNPFLLILRYDALKKFQIWRIVTCILYYPLNPSSGFHYLVNLYFLYKYSKMLESVDYAGHPADYLFLLVFNCLASVVLGLIFEVPVLFEAMILSVLYVWCRMNKDTIVTFWFGTRFKALYLPWVLLIFNMIVSGGGFMELLGIVVGHLYFFLTIIYPQQLGGPRLVQTPSIFKQWFPDQVSGVHGFGRVPTRPAAAQQRDGGGAGEGGGFFRGGHNWGRGNVLGDR